MDSVVAERISDGLGRIERWERDRGLLETADEIMQRVCEGERLKQVCKSKGWPYAMVAQWVAGNAEVNAAYEGALRIAADEMALSRMEVADNATPETVSVAKLQVDTGLRLAGKLYRDRYGDKVDVKHGGVMPVLVIEVAAALAPAVPEQKVVEEIPKERISESVSVEDR